MWWYISEMYTDKNAYELKMYWWMSLNSAAGDLTKTPQFQSIALHFNKIFKKVSCNLHYNNIEIVTANPLSSTSSTQSVSTHSQLCCRWSHKNSPISPFHSSFQKLHLFKFTYRIKFKILSLTYKSLQYNKLSIPALLAIQLVWSLHPTVPSPRYSWLWF